MCYRASVYQPRVESTEEARPAHGPGLPRTVGVAAAVLAAAAFAGLVVLPLARDAAADERAVGAAQVATNLAQPVSLEKSSSTLLPADDGVPTNTTASAQAAGHDCHHGL